MDRRYVGRGLSLVIILGAIAATLFTPLSEWISVPHLREGHLWLTELIEARPLLSATAFFLMCVVATGACFPAAPLIGVSAGALFGFWTGLIIVSVASSIGSTIAFLDARYLFRDWLKEKFARRMASIDRGIERHGAVYLLTLRLNPIVPYWMVNLAMGLTKMRIATYIPLTAAGLLPATFIYVNAGVKLATTEKPGEVVSVSLIVLLLLLSLFPLIINRIISRLRPGPQQG